MQWISTNSQTLLVLVNAGMLLVWMFHAQLLLTSVRRGRRAKAIVNVGVGRGLNSYCLLANVSHEAIFVQVVVATLYNKEDRSSRAITDRKVRTGREDSGADEGVSRIQAQTVQGPLEKGSYLDLGTFGDIYDAVLDRRGGASESDRERYADRYSLELTVIVTFGPENQPIGVRRRFEFSRSEAGEQFVQPATVDTVRMTGPRHRRQMRRWLQQYL